MPYFAFEFLQINEFLTGVHVTTYTHKNLVGNSDMLGFQALNNGTEFNFNNFSTPQPFLEQHLPAVSTPPLPTSNFPLGFRDPAAQKAEAVGFELLERMLSQHVRRPHDLSDDHMANLVANASSMTKAEHNAYFDRICDEPNNIQASFVDPTVIAWSGLRPLSPHASNLIAADELYLGQPIPTELLASPSQPYYFPTEPSLLQQPFDNWSNYDTPPSQPLSPGLSNRTFYPDLDLSQTLYQVRLTDGE
jgi:hypothetical protein